MNRTETNDIFSVLSFQVNIWVRFGCGMFHFILKFKLSHFYFCNHHYFDETGLLFENNFQLNISPQHLLMGLYTLSNAERHTGGEMLMMNVIKS